MTMALIDECDAPAQSRSLRLVAATQAGSTFKMLFRENHVAVHSSKIARVVNTVASAARLTAASGLSQISAELGEGSGSDRNKRSLEVSAPLRARASETTFAGSGSSLPRRASHSKGAAREISTVPFGQGTSDRGSGLSRTSAHCTGPGEFLEIVAEVWASSWTARASFACYQVNWPSAPTACTQLRAV